MRVLMPHQIDAFRFAISKDHVGLFLEMRLRKTTVAIRTVKFWSCKRILVCTPYSTFLSWENDLIVDRETSYIFLSGTKTREKCLSKLNQGYRWNIINKEGYIRIPEIAQINWDCVILDESTCIKNPKSEITKFYLENFRNVKHRMIMTGYPDPNSLLDYISQLNFLDPTILNTSYWAFRFKFCSSPARHLYFVRSDGKEFLKNKISQNCFVMSRKDVGFSCDKIFQERFVELSSDVREIYNELKKYLILNDLRGEEVKKTRHDIAAFSWLRRLCGGFIEKTDQKGFYDLIFQEKLLELKYLMLNEFMGEQVIIACNFLEELHAVSDMLTKNRIAHQSIYGEKKSGYRDMALRCFMKEKIQVIVCQPTCMRYGLNLSNCSTIIDYSITTGETYNQFHDRTIDLEKTKSSLVVSLLVRDNQQFKT